MHGYISRSSENIIQKAMGRMPVVAILGPRQCGKTTLARKLISKLIPKNNYVYLDLQNRVDLNKLSEPELFFE